MPSAVNGETLGQKPLTEERGESETLSGAMETDEEEVRGCAGSSGLLWRHERLPLLPDLPCGSLDDVRALC